MNKAAIIYWSGTGNTEAMATAVTEGAGKSADCYRVSEITADEALNYDILALGCPATGSEELEASEFEPFFSALEKNLSGKKVFLFGSHDWGDGEWMRTWEERVKAAGADLAGGNGIIADMEPSEDILAACRVMGKKIASL